MSLTELAGVVKHVRVEAADGIATLTLDRPQALNALDQQTLEDLGRIIGALERNQDVLGVIVTGAGKGFAAGADLAQVAPYGSEEGRRYANTAQGLFSRLEALEKPVIAAVNGYALGGGCELAMACDIRIASEKAVFGQPEVGLGLIPCFGGTQRLPRLVGVGIAKELIFTGRRVTAQEAAAMGLVNKVVAPEALLPEARAMLTRICANGPLAVRYAKIAIDRGMDVDIRSGLELEKDVAAIVFGTADKDEGVCAFLEKRAPRFQGK